MCHIASGLWLAEPEQLDRAAPMSWWRRRVFKTCRGTQMPHKKKKQMARGQIGEQMRICRTTAVSVSLGLSL